MIVNCRFNVGLFQLLHNHYEVNLSPVAKKIGTDIRHHRDNISIQLVQELVKLFLQIILVDLQAMHSVLHIHLCVLVVTRPLSIRDALVIVGKGAFVCRRC